MSKKILRFFDFVIHLVEFLAFAYVFYSVFDISAGAYDRFGSDGLLVGLFLFGLIFFGYVLGRYGPPSLMKSFCRIWKA